MPQFLAVAIGGAFGVSARYGIDRAIERRTFSVFPWSTFVINLSGCLVIGVLVAALVDRHHTPAWLRVGLVMGVLGGYTTFSTFGQETFDLIESSRVDLAVLYAVSSVVLGVVAVYLGTRLGRVL
jgi:fluoride exporter